MPKIICIDPHASYSDFNYCPSFGVAIAFSFIFGIISLAHLSLAILHRNKRFCWVICMGALWETGGFIFRVFNIMNPTSAGLATGSQLLILLSPLWVNGFAYMVLGRMVYYWIPEKKVWIFKARDLSKWFVWLDICSFLAQGTAASLFSSSDPKQILLGTHIYMGGIGVQEAFILGFASLAIRFHRYDNKIARSTDWKLILYALHTSLAMISIRIIYRLIEFANGSWAYIPTHEWVFYVFECGPMMIAMSIFLVFHPGWILLGEESEFSKLIVTKGDRRWWCCGRRSRQKTDPDFEPSAYEDRDDVEGGLKRKQTLLGADQSQ